MQSKRKVTVGVRQSAGVRRGRGKSRSASNSSLRPKTQVSVVEGFSNVLSANERAINTTYNR